MSTTLGPYPDSEALANHWWWRPGWQIGTRFYAWHLTIEDHPELQALVAGYQDALEAIPTVDPVPVQWLHLTTQGVGHRTDVPDDQRDSIVAAVRRKLADVPSATVTFHRPVLHREAVVIPPLDPAPLLAVRSAIRSGMADVWGADLVPESSDGFRPHVSAGYVNAPSDPVAVRHVLDTVTTKPVTVTFHTASLILMHRDHRMYEWTTAATATMGNSLPN